VETVECLLAITIMMQMTELVVTHLNVEGVEVIKFTESITSYLV